MDSHNYSFIVACYNYITRIVASTGVAKKKIFRIRPFVWILTNYLS